MKCFIFYQCNAEVAQRNQKLNIILVSQVILKLNLSRNVIYKKYSSMKKID